jgi:hypothetical protein
LCRGGRIRTYDLLLPKQARYRATLHPELVSSFLLVIIKLPFRVIFVGVAGFEPTTSCSQSRRDTGLRYTPNWYLLFLTGHYKTTLPNNLCRGGRIRTYDLLLPKQARYRATLHPELVSSFPFFEGLQRNDN